MLLWWPSVNLVNNGDNCSKLFTSYVYFIHSRGGGSPPRRFAAHGLTLEVEAVGVVHQAIEDRIRVRSVVACVDIG
jgi:hypothetical protein